MPFAKDKSKDWSGTRPGNLTKRSRKHFPTYDFREKTDEPKQVLNVNVFSIRESLQSKITTFFRLTSYMYHICLRFDLSLGILIDPNMQASPGSPTCLTMTVKSATLRQGLRCWTVKHSEHTVNTVKHRDWRVLGNFRQNLRRCLQTLLELCEALQNTLAMRFSAKRWGKIFLLNWFSFSDPFLLSRLVRGLPDSHWCPTEVA